MIAGFDLGYNATKVICDERRVMFPSAVGTPDKARFSLNASTSIVLLHPNHVQVGEGAISQSRFLHRREDRSWIESPEWYSLFLAAATELTPATRAELRIVTGLPVAFYDDHLVVYDRLLGTHRAQREGRHAQTFQVSHCRVIPQPFGALLAVTLNDRGRIVDQDLANGTVGIIDVGGKTCNLLSVLELSEVSRETASVNRGGWDAVRAVRDWLATHCPELELRDHRIAEAIIARRLRYYGETIDLTDVVDETLEPLAQQIIGEATQLWNGGAGLDAILVSGGGALLLGPYIQRHFCHARVTEDPVFANALGYWRFARRLAAR
jgi:plasmid segregation protein ParM